MSVTPISDQHLTFAMPSGTVRRTFTGLDFGVRFGVRSNPSPLTPNPARLLPSTLSTTTSGSRDTLNIHDRIMLNIHDHHIW